MTELLRRGHVATREELQAYLRRTRNWGRWGADDQLGTLNLITAERRVAASRLARSGRTVALGRALPRHPREHPTPSPYTFRRTDLGDGGHVAHDFASLAFHCATHLDALCHVWDDDGLYNGRRPDEALTEAGAIVNGIDRWTRGIVTRGILLDVPAFRRRPFVAVDEPVQGWELEELVRAEGIEVRAGDAVAVYAGQDRYLAAADPAAAGKPGLDPTCLAFLREHDIAALLWDMGDVRPNPYGLPFGVHYGIPAYGLAIVDGAYLEELATASVAEGRREFLLIVAPLSVAGGTGGTASPVNPLAVF